MGRHSAAPWRKLAVQAADGGRIVCHCTGSGPGLVILHGMMEAWHSHIELAQALAPTFTVVLPNRRGRGGSAPIGPTSNMAQEVADLRAVLEHTASERLFGVSAGGLIVLEAALEIPVKRLAVFDPTLSIGGSPATAWLARHLEELARGDAAAALVTAMLGAELGPSALRRLPRPWLRSLTRKMLRADARSAPSPSVSMVALAGTIGHDVRLFQDCADRVDRYGRIDAPLLLLGGDQSPAYFKRGLDALHRALPAARRRRLPRMGHGASGNRDRGGRPTAVAAELRAFFGGLDGDT